MAIRKSPTTIAAKAVAAVVAPMASRAVRAPVGLVTAAGKEAPRVAAVVDKMADAATDRADEVQKSVARLAATVRSATNTVSGIARDVANAHARIQATELEGAAIAASTAEHAADLDTLQGYGFLPTGSMGRDLENGSLFFKDGVKPIDVNGLLLSMAIWRNARLFRANPTATSLQDKLLGLGTPVDVTHDYVPWEEDGEYGDNDMSLSVDLTDTDAAITAGTTVPYGSIAVVFSSADATTVRIIGSGQEVPSGFAGRVMAITLAMGLTSELEEDEIPPHVVFNRTRPALGITLDSAFAGGVVAFLTGFKKWYATLGAGVPNTLLSYLRSGLGSDFNFSSTTSA